jgi:hypothetical protein
MIPFLFTCYLSCDFIATNSQPKWQLQLNSAKPDDYIIRSDENGRSDTSKSPQNTRNVFQIGPDLADMEMIGLYGDNYLEIYVDCKTVYFLSLSTQSRGPTTADGNREISSIGISTRSQIIYISY